MLLKKFSVVSLGCFRNNYDSEILAYEFYNKGYIFHPEFSLLEGRNYEGKYCDLLIINTCGFIDKAKQEAIEEIEKAVELKRKKKIAKIVVAGCLVKRYGKDLQKLFPQIDEWRTVISLSRTFEDRLKFSPYYIDFLKICEGCINNCSFCAIPGIKGPLRSKPLQEVIREAKYLDKKGVKELNIIGQDVTSWGKDLGTGEDLTCLIKKILKETFNISWIRLIYTHPRNLSDSLIDLIASEKRICKYIDLPIQHINDRILKLMNRSATRRDISGLIERIRKKIPGCVLRTSVIVGFPTEREEEFKELLNFLNEIKFERLGAFMYSREEGTPACGLTSQVHHNTKKRRFREVMELQKKIVKQVNSRFIGREMDVIVESKENNVFIGRTQYDAAEVDGAVFIERENLKIGQFYKAKIIGSYGYDLIGI